MVSAGEKDAITFCSQSSSYFVLWLKLLIQFDDSRHIMLIFWRFQTERLVNPNQLKYRFQNKTNLAQKEYKNGHDRMGKVMHWELCHSDKCYMHKSESVFENEMYKFI